MEGPGVNRGLFVFVPLEWRRDSAHTPLISTTPCWTGELAQGPAASMAASIFERTPHHHPHQITPHVCVRLVVCEQVLDGTRSSRSRFGKAFGGRRASDQNSFSRVTSLRNFRRPADANARSSDLTLPQLDRRDRLHNREITRAAIELNKAATPVRPALRGQ